MTSSLYSRVLFTSVLLMAAGGGQAQTLSPSKPAVQSRASTQVQAASKPATLAKPALKASAPALSSQLGQRPQSAPISSRGPAQALPSSKPVPVQGATKIYDRDGKLLNDMRPAGPNRVLDTRTGRYYSTEPSGKGVRIAR